MSLDIDQLRADRLQHANATSQLGRRYQASLSSILGVSTPAQAAPQPSANPDPRNLYASLQQQQPGPKPDAKPGAKPDGKPQLTLAEQIFRAQGNPAKQAALLLDAKQNNRAQFDQFNRWDLVNWDGKQNLKDIPGLNQLPLGRISLVGAGLDGANLEGADFRGGNLTRANLAGAKLGGAKFDETNLTGANMTKADLTGASLTGARMGQINLTEANLNHANLEGAQASEATFAGARGTGINLANATLDHANMRGMHLNDASVGGGSMIGADWTHSVLTNSSVGENIQQASVQPQQKTTMPGPFAGAKPASSFAQVMNMPWAGKIVFDTMMG
ncbi:MAG TPA: pentapeptide repeat-containing protein [Alphaproteobacteria bacterium]|nr:pentapeptide repeat-containing protein [Alphaproteobacteria bacterium]